MTLRNGEVTKRLCISGAPGLLSNISEDGVVSVENGVNSVWICDSLFAVGEDVVDDISIFREGLTLLGKQYSFEVVSALDEVKDSGTL